MYIEFINVFFIPVISVLVYFKLKKIELVFSAKYFSCYAIFSIFISLLTKAILRIIKILFFFCYTDMNTMYYTIVATFIATILPFLFYNISFIVGNKKKEK